jgi:uncharacterized protein YaeQ
MALKATIYKADLNIANMDEHLCRLSIDFGATSI